MADTERKPRPRKRQGAVAASSPETPTVASKPRRSRKAGPAKAVKATPTDLPPVAGRKGGSEKVHTPVEAPDSVRSVARAKMLFALGEGEYAGNLDGRRIRLDGTPLIGADGSENFPGVKWEFRPGTQHQEYIAGLPAVENETSVGVELRSDTPWVKDLTNPELSAARVRLSWPALQERKDNGDVVGYRIDYAIDLSVDGGLWKEVLAATLNDKTTTKYERSHRIDLPKSATGWSLRVRRLTPNTQTTNSISDTMRVEAITEVIDAKLRYPNTALLYIEFDASQFQSIPKVSCEPDMRVIRVPNNYDPVARTYSGIWDGTFKWAWTDNPAWVLYDIILNKRFGMGRRLDMSKVDRWELYEIARYCDELVSDGKGGQEPRFTCNVYIQKRADAWTVLRDIAAIFRGITYWSGSEMVVQADKPSDVEFVFSRSNVVDGKFSYDAQSERTRYSSALVSWDNPDNAYESQPQPVSIPALIRRYNFNQTEITAIGCTRQSEADRRGRWLLLTNSVDRGIKFGTGLDGYLPKPGRIIGVADALLAGRQLGGRISSATARQIKVDREVQVKAGDRLIVNLPSGKAEARTVSAVSGRSVTVTADFSEVPKAQAQWGLESADLVIQQYRVTKVSRSDNGFEITGVMNDPGKYDQVDSGSRLEPQPISVIPARTQQAPTGVAVSSYTRTEQGLAVTTLRAEWQAAPAAIAYTAEWRKDSGAWIAAPRTSGLGFEVPGIYAGRYMVRVRAVNALEVSSLPAYSPETVLNGKEGAPPTVATFTVTPLPWGMALAWTFPDGADDTRYTEIEQNTAATDERAALLGLYPYPQRSYELTGLAAGVSKHFRARLVDTSGNAGPWTDWVLGTSSADPSDYLPLITEEFVHSALGEEMLSRIDKIDMDGPGSVNERVGEVRNELNQQVGEVNNAIETVKSSVTDARSELQQQLAAVDQEVDTARSELQQQINTVSALAGSLPYNKDKAYTLNQGVLGADGKLYQALKAVPMNNPPPNATYWTDVGQAIVTAAGTATRVGKVETDVSTLNGTSTAQATKIEGLQSGLTTTNGNVTAAQQAAQAAATAAGAKGEVIYGSAAPAAEKRLTQNLWIDTTGNANTPKRWNGSTWVTVTDKVATDAAAAAANALAVAQTKADAQAVQSVTTRVTDVEGTVSAQGQAMTGLQSSLTTTKQDVTAAQQAAQAAATAAGAKGEVIYGSTAPAADKRLTQNLWIDTTGNANTPKRWNGSTWVAVSDKVATDAAAAAAAANALAATKADASAVNLLTNRVSNAEGVLTSYSSDITQLKNGLSAAQSFVAGKAWEFTGSTRGWFGTLSGSTFTAGPLFATSGNCPNLQCNFTPAIAGAENPYLRIRLRRRNTTRAGAQMYWANEDGGLAEARRMAWTINTSTTDWQDIEIDLSGHAGWNGKNILAIRLDMMSASDTTGEIDIAYIAVGRRSIAASAEAVSSLSSAVSDADGKLTSQGQSIVSLQNGLTTTNGNVTTAQQAAQAAATAAGAKGEVIYGSSAPAADKRLAQNLWIDTTGNANTPKRWNGSTWVTVTDKVATDAAAAAQSALTEVAKKADASTVQNLSNTVAQHGQDITAQGQAMTAIDAAIAEVGGENLLYNPTFNRASATDANVPDGWVLEGSATRNPSMVSSWLNSGERAFRVAVTGVTNASPYLSLVTQSTQRPKVASGQSVTTSVNVRRMAESGLLALRIIYQWINEAGGVISAPANGFVPITVEGSRHSFTSVAPEGAVRFNVYFRIHSQTAAAVNGSLELARPQSEYGSRATGWRDNGQVTAGEIAANVSATSLLSGRVEQTEQGLVTHGQSIVTLQGGLTTTNQGVTAAQQAAQAAATAAGAKGEVIYGSSAPAADKRLAQNLWIDTTGNANTPKRWNGSTW
uniref:host specificity protein J n=1 Tax=Pseudomonas sp. PARCl1 TaxID=2853444 RepID=UPI00248DD99C